MISIQQKADDMSKMKIYLIFIITGTLYALSFLNLSFIMGKSLYWKEPNGDIITHMIGAIYYAQDAWRWPLFYVPKLAFPEGTSIVYTDSLPLLALIAKLTYKVIGQWINYFGYWFLTCFALLGLFTGLCLQEIGCKDRPTQIAGILLALSCPALLTRWPHAALMGQFLIVWALFLYLNYHRTKNIRHFTLNFMILGMACVLIQTYFILMIIPFFIAGLMQEFIQKELILRHAIISFSAVLLSILFIAYISGMIGPDSVKGDTGGFGLFSMNLLSPFIPAKQYLPEFIYKHINWSTGSKGSIGFTNLTWDATGGQYGGYNYLGIGLFFLILINIRFISHSIRSHLFLFLSLLCLMMLALSNRIYLGDWLIADIPLQGIKIFDYFRCSQRLFWPVYYILVVMLTVVTFKRFQLRTARLIIIAAVLLQLVETQPLRDTFKVVENQSSPRHISEKSWKALIITHQFLIQIPSYQCGGFFGQNFNALGPNLELLLLAAHDNKPTNSAYLARSSRNCEKERAEGLNTKIEHDGLYVFDKDFRPTFLATNVDKFKSWCREFKYGYVCTQKFATHPELASFSF